MNSGKLESLSSAFVDAHSVMGKQFLNQRLKTYFCFLEIYFLVFLVNTFEFRDQIPQTSLCVVEFQACWLTSWEEFWFLKTFVDVLRCLLIWFFQFLVDVLRIWIFQAIFLDHLQKFLIRFLRLNVLRNFLTINSRPDLFQLPETKSSASYFSTQNFLFLLKISEDVLKTRSSLKAKSFSFESNPRSGVERATKTTERGARSEMSQRTQWNEEKLLFRERIPREPRSGLQTENEFFETFSFALCCGEVESKVYVLFLAARCWESRGFHMIRTELKLEAVSLVVYAIIKWHSSHRERAAPFR